MRKWTSIPYGLFASVAWLALGSLAVSADNDVRPELRLADKKTVTQLELREGRPLTAGEKRQETPLLRTDPLQTSSISRAPVTGLDLRLGLRDTVLETIGTAPLLKAAEAQVRAADAAVLRGNLGYFPKVTANIADYSLFSSHRATSDSSEQRAAISLQWAIFDGFQRENGIESARRSSYAARLNVEAVEGDLTLQSVAAYLNFLGANRSIALLDKNMRALTRLRIAVRERQALGFASTADVERVNADLAELEQELVGMQLERDNAKEAVASMVGRSVTPATELPVLERHLKIGEEALVQHAVARNPRLRAAQFSAEAAEFTTEAVRGRYLPQVNVIGSYQYDLANVRSERERDSWKIGVQLSVPLVDLTTLADVRRSSEEANVARFQADQAFRETGLQVRSLWNAHKAGLTRLKLARRQVKAQDSVMRSAQEQYELGLLSLEQVLTARRDLASAEVILNRVAVEQYLTSCRLLVAAGIFEPSMLNL